MTINIVVEARMNRVDLNKLAWGIYTKYIVSEKASLQDNTDNCWNVLRSKVRISMDYVLHLANPVFLRKHIEMYNK